MTTDVERAMADLVTIGELDEGTPAESVRDLVVYHARSLEGLEQCAGLETLSLIGCAVGDYALVSRLHLLRVLVIENSDLTDASWAAGLGLRVAVVRRNRLRNGSPLLRLTAIQSVDLTGNPLDGQTRAAVAAAGALGMLCRFDDDELAQTNTRLADARTGIVAYRQQASLWACATGLDRTASPEAAHVATSIDQLDEVARGALRPGRLLGLETDDRDPR